MPSTQPDLLASCHPLVVHCKHDEIVALDAYPAHPKNDNTHPPEQLALFEKVLRHQGIRRAAVVSTLTKRFVAGHGLREALRTMGVTGIPVDYQTFASEDDELRHLMADNRLPALSVRDDAQTLANLQELDSLDLAIDLTGFTDDDMQSLDLDPGDGVDDGGGDGGGGEDLSDTQLQLGEYRIKISRADYLVWQDKIRAKVGFEKKHILKEIKRRVGL